MTRLEPLEASTFPLHGLKLIEASAGTGKTYSITNLYLRLLLGRGTERPLLTREILVLTFTIAATDELRNRIRARVATARELFAVDATDGTSTLEDDAFLMYLRSSSTAPEQDRKLLSHALLTMDEAAIFTTHGFCARVLSEQSFETGQLFNQAPDADQNALLQTCAEDCFRSEILTMPPALESIALKLWPTPESLVQSIGPIIFRAHLVLEPAAEDVTQALDAWLEDIQSCKQTWLEVRASELIRAASFKGTTKTVKRLDQLDQYCASDSLEIDIWENWNEASLNNNQSKKTTMPEHPVFGKIESIWQRRNLLSQTQFNLWHRVINNIRQRMTLLKTRLNLMTLDDLLKHLYQSLENQSLVTRLRAKWPIAMIDEFQDTDDLQYGIFKRIYMSGNISDQPKGSGLVFIGDPKQAIYQFRGADIYTYINAKRQVQDEIFSLTTNWRSTAPMVAAVNHLFSHGEPFGVGDDIQFEPVRAAPGNQHKSITQAHNKVPPVQIFTYNQPTEPKQGPGGIGNMRQMLVEHGAETCAQLLTASNQYLINHKPVIAGQIAFLVRRHSEAAMVQAALRKRQIKSVYLSHSSVFQSTCADDLLIILEAIVEPGNDRLLRRALATRLLQLSLSEIAALNQDVILFQRLTEEFAAYHHRWRDSSFAAMMDQLIQHRAIAQNWLSQPDGERELTNLRHLVELLQARNLEVPGLRPLLQWFKRNRGANVSTESDQLRLESDQHLVKIVTMHGAKGLEYDIVLIPLLDSGTSPKKGSKQPVLYHAATEDGFESRLNLSAKDESGKSNAALLAENERLGEDMRLLYVALTRAKYQCYLGLPILKSAKTTAASMLFGLDSQLPIETRLAPLEQLPNTLFKHQRLETVPKTTLPQQESVAVLTAPERPPRIPDQWRMHSYTGLTLMLSTAQKAAKDLDVLFTPGGFADDDLSLDDEIGPQTFSRFTFPRGPKTGIALHELLELLDFSRAENISSLVSRALLKAGIVEHSAQWQATLTQWIADILGTPLNLQGTLQLGVIKRESRLDEMEFHFPMQLGQSFIKLIQSYGYLPHQTDLHLPNLNGMMTGFIDLVFEFQGQYYVADYKSNDLGKCQASYQQSHLMAAMISHQYDLQYLIYTLALHRYLNSRLPNYNYERDFGGVYYLFLRAMSGASNSSADNQGVFFDRPEQSLIEQMDELIA